MRSIITLLLLITAITILVPFAVYCYDRTCRTAEKGDTDDKNNVILVAGAFYKRKAID